MIPENARPAIIQKAVNKRAHLTDAFTDKIAKSATTNSRTAMLNIVKNVKLSNLSPVQVKLL